MCEGGPRLCSWTEDMQVTAAAYCSAHLTHVSRGVRLALPARQLQLELEPSGEML